VLVYEEACEAEYGEADERYAETKAEFETESVTGGAGGWSWDGSGGGSCCGAGAVL
jgi:hypothetical protein